MNNDKEPFIIISIDHPELSANEFFRSIRTHCMAYSITAERSIIEFEDFIHLTYFLNDLNRMISESKINKYALIKLLSDGSYLIKVSSMSVR